MSWDYKIGWMQKMGSLKKTMSKYPRTFLHFRPQPHKWGKLRCNLCQIVPTAGERLVVVTTETTYMRGDDEVQTLCHACAVNRGLPFLTKGQLGQSVEEYQKYLQRKKAEKAELTPQRPSTLFRPPR